MKKVREKPYHISSQCGERLCRQYLHGRGTRFYPPSGGASRAFGLPLAAKRVLRAGARTHFRRPEGRRAERRNRALPGYRLCGLLDFDISLTKKKLFFSAIELPTIPPLFALVSRCVGRMGPGWHPYPCRLSFGVSGSLCESVRILSLGMPSGSYECSDNSSRNPWLSRKCSGMVCFPAAPYQNFYVREEAETWRPEQETGSSPSG